MPTCIIRSCPYRKLGKSQSPEIILHVFPKNAQRIRAWLEQTGHHFKDIDGFIDRILGTKNIHNYRICSAHFAEGCYTHMGNTRVLKVDAVPTIFPPGDELISEAFRRRTSRRMRLVHLQSTAKALKSSTDIGSSKPISAPTFAKRDAGTQTEGGRCTADQVVQTEELSFQDEKCTVQIDQEDCGWCGWRDLVESGTPLKDKLCQKQGVSWIYPSGMQKCEQDRSHMAEKILSLTLEIFYLLTGEKPGWRGGRWSRSQSPIMEPPPPSLKSGKNSEQKILEVANKMIELLTGEVPIRCQDVTVYFSMEEWRYVEGHRDLYKDVMLENCLSLLSPVSPEVVSSGKPARRSRKVSAALDSKNKISRVTRSQDGLYSISTRSHHMPSRRVKEEPLAVEAHLHQSDISTPTHHTHTVSSRIKREPILYVEEHHPHPDTSTPTHHGPSTSTDVKDETALCIEGHHPHLDISSSTRRRPATSINVKGITVLNVEHLPHVDISSPAQRRESTSTHVKETTFSAEEHLPHCNSSSPTCLPTSIHHTSTQVKGEPISDDQHLPHETDYTTIIIEEGSTSCDEESPPHSKISISHGRCTSAPTMKEPLLGEDERVRYSELYTPPSPVQYIPVRINDDFLLKQEHLQHWDISTPRSEDLVEEEPERLYADNSGMECDNDVRVIPLNLSAALSQRTFLSHPNFSDRSLFCPECGKSFTDKARVEAHLRSHWGDKPYSCSVCLKGFRSKSKLVVHQMMHSGEKPYACSECGKRFAQNAYLQRHMRGHTGEKPFPCSICGKCFACRSDMVKHELTHTGARPHPCVVCGKRFTKKSHLNRHMRIHTGEKPFCCPDCGRSFGCNSDMVSHQRIHQGIKPFSCSECGKCFLRKQDALRHQSVHR